MKVKLLNDGSYIGLENVKFPVIVEATQDGPFFRVLGEELQRVGADPELFLSASVWTWVEDLEATIAE